MIDPLLEVLALKALDRAGWRRAGIAHPESVAAHSWGVAWLALVLCPPHLDRGRALAYAVLHDLAEVRVGDITPQDGVPAAVKASMEDAAVRSIAHDLPDIRALWLAYERQTDPEARYVRQLDRLDMALQAVAYAADGHDTTEFLESAERFIDDPQLTSLLSSLRKRITG